MPATSVYGFRYQSLSDPPDGAALGQNLAEDVEAALQANLTLGGDLTIGDDLVVPGDAAVTGSLTVAGNNIATQIAALLSPPRCQLRQAAVQSFTNGTFTAMLWDTEDIDSHNGHSTVSLTSRYVAQVAGRYQLTGKIGWAGNATGRRVSLWRKNTADIPGTQVAISAVTASDVEHPVVTVTTFLAVSDYVELVGLQESGGSLNTAGTAETMSVMTVLWIAST